MFLLALVEAPAHPPAAPAPVPALGHPTPRLCFSLQSLPDIPSQRSEFLRLLQGLLWREEERWAASAVLPEDSLPTSAGTDSTTPLLFVKGKAPNYCQINPFKENYTPVRRERNASAYQNDSTSKNTRWPTRLHWEKQNKTKPTFGGRRGKQSPLRATSNDGCTQA